MLNQEIPGKQSQYYLERANTHKQTKNMKVR